MKKYSLIFFFTLLIPFTAYAQIGSVDTMFKVGTGFGPDEWTGKCDVIVQQADGKLLVGGQFESFNGNETYYIARLNLDGSLDAGFSSQFEDSWGAKVAAIAIQADGKIVIGGSFSEINGVSRNNIARLNSDGSLDEIFDPASGFNQEVKTLAIQSDGKILVGGLFTHYDAYFGGANTPVNGIARLNVDGSIDASFQVGSGFSGGSGIGQRQIHQVLSLADGKILVSGHYSNYNGEPSLLLTRLNSDGTLDKTFDASANFAKAMDGFYGQVYNLKTTANGEIIIGGNYGNTNSLAFGVDRLHADGTLDSTFKTTHSFSNLINSALAVQSDGKVCVANRNFGQPSEAFVVERYNADGSLDSSFQKTFLNSDVTDLIIQQDGNICFVGYFKFNPIGILRLNGDTPFSLSLAKNSSINPHVYPNPTQDFIQFAELPEEAYVAVYSSTGALVIPAQQMDTNRARVDLRGLEKGVYFIQVKVKEKSSWTKVLKQD
ncbi:MAG: T9SS type A sorting domain-containing protein [Bacteroidetes bacterium]|nr:MAG: T9SS type A sorting domain-containing protein [Bacteroidota bacterium]